MGALILSKIYVSDHYADFQDSIDISKHWIFDVCWLVIFSYGPKGSTSGPGYILETNGQIFRI